VRELPTTPSSPVVPAVDDEPTAPPSPRPSLAEDTTLLGKPMREGPTGPSKKQRREAIRNASLLLGVLALSTAIALGALFKSEPPPPMAALPVMRGPEGSVAVVKPINSPEEESAAVSLEVGPEPTPHGPATVLVDPGKETYRPLDYNRFKRVRPKSINVRGNRAGNGQPELDLKVYGPASAGRNELRADVVVDGTHRGLSPLKLRVTVGVHVLQITSEPYPMTDIELTALPGQKQILEIELLPPGSEAWARESTYEPAEKRKQ
jgi:hypothetical protein